MSKTQTPKKEKEEKVVSIVPSTAPSIDNEDEIKEHLLMRLNEAISTVFQTDPPTEIDIKMDENLFLDLPGFTVAELDEVIAILEEDLSEEFSRGIVIMQDTDYEYYSSASNLIADIHTALIETPSNDELMEVVPVYDANGVQCGEELVRIDYDDTKQFNPDEFPAISVLSNYAGPGPENLPIHGAKFNLLMSDLRKDTPYEAQNKKFLTCAVMVSEGVASLTELVTGNMYFQEDIEEIDVIEACEEILHGVLLFIDIFNVIRNTTVFGGKDPELSLYFESPVEVTYLHHLQVHTELLSVFCNELLRNAHQASEYKGPSTYERFHPILTKIVAVTNDALLNVGTNAEEVLYA